MSSLGKRKKAPKPSGSVSISRPHVEETQRPVPPLARSQTFYRQGTGKLGSTTSYVNGPASTSVHEDVLGPWDPHFFDEPPPDPEPDPLPAQSQPVPKKMKPIQEWLPYRQEYVEELLRHDGRAGHTLCGACGEVDGELKCVDCFGNSLLCAMCTKERHLYLPLHRIQRWTGDFFLDTSLMDIGFVVQLGHDGLECPAPGPIQHRFPVVATNGVHHVNLQFCECHANVGASHHRTQLLRARWFTSSVVRPRNGTAFTFDVLDNFHLLTLQGKTSAFDYYLSLVHKTDNVLPLDIDRYEQFQTAIRIWRHMKLVKRAGRGHDPEGVASTSPGGCAVECPACPHPGRNLPEGWENAPASIKWIYALILAIDANFRLKNKDRNITNDVPLGDGWAHWVPEEPFMDYVGGYGYQEEPNMCDSQLRAVDHANTRFSRGYKSTGVGGVVCARHGLVRKNGLGDLQKGERYANMDFIVFFTLLNVIIAQIVLSYDIACQWSRNLSKRIPQMGPYINIFPWFLSRVKYVIPKLHIYGHGAACQFRYSLNFLKWSARTNGEDIERWWSHINPVSMSTKEMGPGARHDTIDDHAAAWNWRKITLFGSSLLTQLRKGLRMRAKHDALLSRATGRFSADVIKRWEKMVDDWDEDVTKPCPYEEPTVGCSVAQVKLELTKEEMEDAKQGILPLHDISPHSFLITGLELEDQQRVLQAYARGKRTVFQVTEVQEKRIALHRRIEAWREIRAIYMPAASELPAASYSASFSVESPESVPLLLPSAIPPSHWPSGGLADKEKRLRIAQADDALAELRRLLRVTMGLWDYKYTQAGFGQKAATRTRTMIWRFRDKINRCAERYRAARSSLLKLDPCGDWLSRLRVLEPADVRAPLRDDDEKELRNIPDREKRVGEGKREMSWIWMAQGSKEGPTGDISETNEEEIGQSLRVEWMKTRARFQRWDEDVTQVVEEMRRVLVFLTFKAGWWIEQGTSRSGLDEHLDEGLRAYAAKQADVYRRLANCFAAQWRPVLEAYSIEPDWPAEYLHPPSQPYLSADPVPFEPLFDEEIGDDDIFD